MDCNWWRTNEAVIGTLQLLLLGQLVSFVRSLLSFTSSLVATLGVDTPLALSFFSYSALALVYGSILVYRGQKLRVPLYWYVLLGFVDVQGNYLGGSKPLLGDVLVIAGTVFYALSNVGEEFCVKKRDRIEVVTMIGLFGMLVSVVEISILERKTLESVKWSAEIILAFAGYALSSFLFYTLVPCVLKMGGATMFNLSILTSDMWAVVIRIFFYHQQVDWLYYLSFAIVVIGLIIYSKTEKHPVTTPALEDENVSTQYQLLNEENGDSRAV